MIWHEPENTGEDITGYDVQYKKTTDLTFGVNQTGTDTVATITGLEADTSYQVRVRGKNGEADTTENWSQTGTGSTNKEDNIPPTFFETADANTGSVTRSVRENTVAGQNVGGAVNASDAEARPLVYRLGGPDADSFDFDMSSGQIRTKRGVTYDHETKVKYYVTVSVFDVAGGSDALGVTIGLINVNEPPEAPTRPTVRATAKEQQEPRRELD